MPLKSHQPDLVDPDRGRVGDRLRRADRDPAAVVPDRHAARVDVHEVGAAVAVDVDHEQPAGIVAARQHGRIRHLDRLGPAAVAQIGPVAHRRAVDADEILQAVAGHVGQLDVRVAQVGRGRGAARNRLRLGREAVVGAVVEGEELVRHGQHVGPAVAVQVHEARDQARRRDRRRAVQRHRPPEPAALPERHVARGRRRERDQVHRAGAEQVGERDARRGQIDRARHRGQRERVAPAVAPVVAPDPCHAGPQLEQLGQPVAVPVDQLHGARGERRRRRARQRPRAAGQRARRDRGVAERRRRRVQRRAVRAVPPHGDRREQREPGRLARGVAQVPRAHQRRRGVERVQLDPRAALRGADQESRSCRRRAGRGAPRRRSRAGSGPT